MKRFLIYGAYVLVGIVIGTMAAGATGDYQGPRSERAPEVEVQAEVQVPESCLDAIDDARVFADIAVESTVITKGYISLIPRAFESGIAQDLAESEEIIARMDELTQETNALTERTQQNSFPKNSAECEEAAG